MDRSPKAQLSGALCCLYGTCKESYFLEALVFSLTAVMEEDEGLYIPSFLEDALGGDGNHQIKMARTIQAQERRNKKCFICQSGDHLMRDHYKVKNGAGSLHPKGPPQNKSAQETAKGSPLGQAMSQGAPSK